MSALSPFRPEGATLLPGIYQDREKLNSDDFLSFSDDNLLRNHHMEATLWAEQFRATTHGTHGAGDDIHWGWESPSSQVRGHFLGHWLSVAARHVANTGDAGEPESMPRPDHSWQWGEWVPSFRTCGQERSIRFSPLHSVADEAYAVYFPVSGRTGEIIRAEAFQA